MILLVQVGNETWVDPDAIEAIDWSYDLRCPRILMRSGHHIYAMKFWDQGLDNEEARTGELIAFIRQAVRNTPAAVSYGVM